MSIYDNLCEAWEIDEVRAEDSSLEGPIFSIDFRAHFTYPSPDTLLDYDEDGVCDLDSVEEVELRTTHEVPVDSMNKDPQSAIHDMLNSMRVPVDSFFVYEISECAARMSENEHYKDRKVLRMSVIVYVAVDELPFDKDDDEVDFDDDNDYVDDDDENVGPRPATKEEIEGLEKIMMVDDSNDCSICLALMSKGLEAKRMPNCKHVFHGKCIDKWLGRSNLCPICRSPV